MLNTNLLLNTDSYKTSHSFVIEPGTEYMYYYIESRGGLYDETLFFGLQMYLKEYLSKPITQENIDEAEEFWNLHGEPFDREKWEYILHAHNGYLPLSIKAVPEGTVVPTKNVLVTVVNTDPKCYWLPGFIETALLRAVWYPTTVANNSFHCKRIIMDALQKSCDNPETEIPFRMHDFGARGVESFESAAIGGCSHLVNFMGSDTVSGVLAARKYYGEHMAAYSIPASEHSITTMRGQDHEVDFFRAMLREYGKSGKMFACVCDSYNLPNAVNNLWGTILKEELVASGATLVLRPDSGDVIFMPTATVEWAAEKFGYTVNSKGYKVLAPCVRVIQGDGVDVESLPKIYARLLEKGFSAENLACGSGGGLLQKVNRDTQKFAMKCSAAFVNGVWRDIFKNPITDPGKRSKKGRFALLNEGPWQTMPLTNETAKKDQLVEVFRDGKLLKDWTFAEIRERVDQAL